MRNQLLLPLFFLVPGVALLYAELIARAFRAAMACCGINGKVAAACAGLSESQLSRQLSGGTLQFGIVWAQGPEFRRHFLRLLDDLSGVDAQSSSQTRRTA